VAPKLIYLDTNVYARSFDDQTQSAIRAESNAFLAIIRAVKAKQLVLLSSDILRFEIDNILNEAKHAKVEAYLELCIEHIDSSTESLNFGKQLQTSCHIRARDALHVASAILGKAQYFLSCDKQLTQRQQARCYRQFARAQRQAYFSAMNPVLFVEKMQKGELA
jgi:predicted nucleic acid-binding protein